jgi:Mrp family chromosome partitioning ATPase
MTTQISDQLELVRVDIETAYPLPALVVVSSALESDGKSMVANELAHSMVAAGYSTLLILTEEQSGHKDDAPPFPDLSNISAAELASHVVRVGSPPLSTLALPNAVQHAVGRHAVCSFLMSCREMHAVTIVDAPVMLSNAFAMSAVLAANGVLLSARTGRRICAADHKLARIVGAEEISFRGVVSVDENLIRSTKTPPRPNLIRKKPSPASTLRESPST